MKVSNESTESSWTQISLISVAYRRKYSNVVAEDVFHSLYRQVMEPGNWTGGSVLLIQMPLVAYWITRRVDSTKAGIAVEHGCWIPKPPLFVDIELIRSEWDGTDSLLVSLASTFSTMAVKASAMSLCQRFQLTGRSEKSLVRTSAAKRWVILWAVQVLKS